MMALTTPMAAVVRHPRSASQRRRLRKYPPPSYVSTSPLQVSLHANGAGVSISNAQALYASLPLTKPDCIRVAEFRYANCSRNDARIYATLRVVDLAHRPSFTAMSYVWGQPTPGEQSTICCNGMEIPVTSNCRQAILSVLRSKSYWDKGKGSNRTTLCIWIDALCINQEDNVEKASQIAHMEEIYTWSEAAFVWLGPSTEASDIAMQKIAKASKSCSLVTPGIPWSDGQRLRTYTQDRWIAQMGLLRIKFPFWKARFRIEPSQLEAFLNCDWLSRVWTFQEIILASNPVLVRGEMAISWATLHKGLNKIERVDAGYIPTWWPGSLFSAENDTSYVYGDHNLRDHRANYGKIYASSQTLLSSVHKWKRVSNTWLLMQRPTAWRGAVRRIIPRKDGHWHSNSTNSNAQTQSISIQEYQAQTVKYLPSYIVQVLTSILVFLLLVAGLSGATQIIIAEPNADFVATSVSAMTLMVVGLLLVPIWIIPRIQKVYQKSKQGCSKDQESEIMSVIQALRERHSTEAKDQVFALYGVLGMMDMKFRSPSYGHSLDRVYTEFFISLVTFDSSLIRLVVDAGEDLIPGTPTWVPNWHSLAARSWLPTPVIYNFDFNAARSRITISSRRIEIRGLELGKVSFISDRVMPCTCGRTKYHRQGCDLQVTDSRVSKWTKFVVSEAPILEAVDSTPQALFDALEGSDGGSEEHDGFNRWFNSIRERSNSAGEASPCNMPHDVSAGEASGKQTFEVDPYVEHVAKQLHGKRALLFSRELHAGTGPVSAVVGDVIVALEGVGAPMVLRAEAGSSMTFKVVGPALFAGIGVEELDTYCCERPEEQWETITLV